MAKAPSTAAERVKVLLGSGWMLSVQERADIVSIVAGLEERLGERATDRHEIRAEAFRDVIDRLLVVHHEISEPIAAYWIGACSAVVMQMMGEETSNG